MPGKKGYQATRRLRERGHDKRGGNNANELPAGLPGSLAYESARYLQSLAVRNYTPDTIEGRRDALKVFLLWAQERDLTQPAAITKAILESYQRHLWRWRKKNGMPLGISTQRSRLGTLKDLFKYLVRQDALGANPASELEMPRQEKRLPREALGIQQIAAVINIPDIRDALGRRDRAMLEMFYSTGIRRAEAANLTVFDVDLDRATLRVKGKGRKERLVPLGKQAVKFLGIYLKEARPKMLPKFTAAPDVLWLDRCRTRMHKEGIGMAVKTYGKAAGIAKQVNLHAFRRTCATHLLRHGAHPVVVAQILGHTGLNSLGHYLQTTITDLLKAHAQTKPGK